jgi:hypothetical protein
MGSSVRRRSRVDDDRPGLGGVAAYHRERPAGSGRGRPKYRTLDTFYGALPHWDREDIEMGDSVVAKLAEQAVAAGATDVSHINDCTVVLIDAAKAAAAARAWIEANFQ